MTALLQIQPSESDLVLASLKYVCIFESTLLKPQLCVATYTTGGFVDVNLIFHCKTIFCFCRFELNVINSSCISNVHFCSKNFFIWENRGAGSAGTNQICSDKNCSPFLTRTIADQEIRNMATKPVAGTDFPASTGLAELTPALLDASFGLICNTTWTTV